MLFWLALIGTYISVYVFNQSVTGTATIALLSLISYQLDEVIKEVRCAQFSAKN